MKILGLNIQRRSKLEDPNTALTWENLIENLNPSSCGIRVTKKNALTVSAVWGCINILSKTIATLSCNYIEREGRNKNINHSSPLNLLVHGEPNSFQTSFSFNLLNIIKLCLEGNAYCYIQRDRFYNIVGLLPLANADVCPHLYKYNMYYRVNGFDELLTDDNILHLKMFTTDGITGISPIEKAMEDIGLGIAQRTFGSTFFGNGANMGGVVETAKTLNDKQLLRLQNSFDTNRGAENANKIKILENGLSYKAIAVAPEQAQFLQSRKFTNEEVCRWFGVPPHLLADLERATNNNIEHQSIDFVTHTIQPYITMIEQEFNRKLLKQAIKGKAFFKYNLNTLLRGDAASRAAYYKSMFSVGAMTPNEIREKEDFNPYEGGDVHLTQGANIPIEQAGVDAFKKTAIEPKKPKDE